MCTGLTPFLCNWESYQPQYSIEKGEDGANASLKKVSVSTNPIDHTLNSRPQTFSHLHRKFFVHVYTHVCEWLVSLAISHASVKCECEWVHASVSERMRAMHCPHMNWNLRALNSRILPSSCKWTLEYSQLHSRALAIELTSTPEYLQSFAWVTIFVGVSHNCINKLVHVRDVCLRHSLQRKYLEKNENRPPTR